jgi:hypothetical protein
MSGSTIRVLGVVLGAAAALLYLALISTVGPPIHWPHARARTMIGLYLLTPLLIFAGVVWLCFWIAARNDPVQPPD